MDCGVIIVVMLSFEIRRDYETQRIAAGVVSRSRFYVRAQTRAIAIASVKDFVFVESDWRSLCGLSDVFSEFFYLCRFHQRENLS
jgi:hypothetical protein